MVRRKHIGKYQKGGARLCKHRHTRQHTLLLSIFLILSLAVGGTLAYIAAKTDRVQNQFEPAFVTCSVNANNDSTFDVTNTGNVDAYIRAAIVVNWMDKQGNVRGILPKANDYSLTVNATNWWKDTNTGYYYYKNSVVPKGVTENLITSYGLAAGVTAPSGYRLCVEVVAEAIQADGDTDNGAVPTYQDAWKISSVSG